MDNHSSDEDDEKMAAELEKKRDDLKIDLDKLREKSIRLKVSKNGAIILDPNNPVHREIWDDLGDEEGD